MTCPLTFSPEMAAAIIQGDKTFTRRPVKAYHRLQANPVRVVSVKTRGLADKPPVLWQVGTTTSVKFSRTGVGVYYRLSKYDLPYTIRWLEPDGLWRMTQEAKGLDPDVLLKGWTPFRVDITTLFRQPLAAMNDAAAQQEGFASKAAFYDYWYGLYGTKNVCLDGQTWVIGIGHHKGE